MVPGKILIADDSLKIQQQLTELLKSADIEIVAVSNGEFAVRKLPEVKPDLVLADIFMPVRTGYEVCEFIKESEEFSRVPVLLLASTLEPYDEAEAERVKADGKIEKPFADTKATLATIKEHLDRALSGKPAEPVVSADEFAAAVPADDSEPEAAAPEPKPAPEPEAETLVMTSEAAPTLEPNEEPVGFSEMLEHETAAPAEPPAAEDKPAAPREVEKPELAAAWETTTPPEGAPDIPSPPAAEAAPAAPEEDMGPAEPFPPEEFAAAFSSEETPAPTSAPEAAPPAQPATSTGSIDHIVEEIAKKVVEQLSPEVMEKLSKELAKQIAKPLAEKIVKKKLIE